MTCVVNISTFIIKNVTMIKWRLRMGASFVINMEVVFRVERALLIPPMSIY